MKKHTITKKQTDRKLNALQNKIKDLRIKGDKLAERHSMLLKRQKEIACQHGGSKVKGSDMIELNVGGKKMHVLRETLTLIEGSRLEVLFSGRWESKLLRDEEGCVFFDLDSYYFKKVIQYLSLAKKVQGTSKEKKLPNLPKFTDAHEQKIFSLYINFFRLQGSKEGEPLVPSTIRSSSNDSNSEDDEDNASYEGLLTSLKEEEKDVADVEKELDEIEEKLEAEEEFVSFFIDEDQSLAYDSDGNISFASMGSNMSSIFDRGSSSSSVSDANKTTTKNSILKLWIDDEIVPVKRSTLCLCKDSQLAEDFGSSDWVDKHSFKCDDETDVILIEYPPSYFKLIINRLRLRAMMTTSGGELPKVKMNNTEEMRGLGLKDLVSVLFEGKEDFILGDKPIINMDSKIVTSESEVDRIQTWLAEVNKTSEPQLLYRASRDGWDASNFHSKCDNKGATITILKTTQGYVFGGYADQPWNSHNSYVSSYEAFLFSLKCHASSVPTKMKLRSGQNSHAMYCHSSYGPLFGSGHDLQVNGGQYSMKNGSSSLGNTYELPSASNNTFLAGNRSFQITEVEVFQLSESEVKVEVDSYQIANTAHYCDH